MVELLIDEFNFVTFDYTGYGYSDKDKCTLGLKEMDDLESVINYVREEYNFKRVYIWGRSMGAVTAALLAHRSENSLFDGMVLDSPYSSTKEMLCNVLEKVPNFLLYMLFVPLGSKLKRETGHDMMAINLNEIVPKLTVPVIISVADGDTLAGVSNVQSLFENYGAKSGGKVIKHFFKFGGDHSSNRDDDFIRCGRGFFEAIENEYQQIIASALNQHDQFSSHRYLMAVHGTNSPKRLQKTERFLYNAEMTGNPEDLCESMFEFIPKDMNQSVKARVPVKKAISGSDSMVNSRRDGDPGLVVKEGFVKPPVPISAGELTNSRFGSLSPFNGSIYAKQTNNIFDVVSPSSIRRPQPDDDPIEEEPVLLTFSKLMPNKYDMDIKSLFNRLDSNNSITDNIEDDSPADRPKLRK